ncbi:2-phospho-L-lactate transferase CofD family protein [Ornithinimicrobium sp. INDO-MA30-4]|uniref:2-phospho-L-lactate transferase CofD family protein n=1 Tax=Ornithinimicrobium sp. INDO-MA30-4 TaxID=2908651 RepID=UPI002882F882|nr:2-phospho-L-lactate transferase CofD family protein [Ornithinimicrobium sp. INDO-MA30-4]
MRITALSGGVGGARFLRGLVKHLDSRDSDEPHELTVIGNTGDDITLFGLRVCPDLDSVLYTLGGGVNESQGWGREDESFAVKPNSKPWPSSHSGSVWAIEIWAPTLHAVCGLVRGKP